MTTVTIGTKSYDVYEDDIATGEYLAADPVLYPKWTAKTEDQQKGYCVQATRWIDRQSWSGEKEDPDQEGAWPRVGANNAEDGETPQGILNGAMELAGYMAAGWLPTKATTANTTKRLKAGSAEIEYFRGAEGGGTAVPLPAWQLFAPFIGGSGGASSSLAFGTDGSSVFDTSFDRAQPL